MPSHNAESAPDTDTDTDTDADTVALAQRMFDLARAGDAALADYLDAGVPPGLTDAKGDTLVMLAAYHGHAELVAALARRGCPIDRLNDRGQSPLAGAVFKGEDEVIAALLAAGADPSLGSPSAIETARFFGRDDVLATLERHTKQAPSRRDG